MRTCIETYNLRDPSISIDQVTAINPGSSGSNSLFSIVNIPATLTISSGDHVVLPDAYAVRYSGSKDVPRIPMYCNDTWKPIFHPYVVNNDK